MIIQFVPAKPSRLRALFMLGHANKRMHALVKQHVTNEQISPAVRLRTDYSCLPWRLLAVIGNGFRCALCKHGGVRRLPFGGMVWAHKKCASARCVTKREATHVAGDEAVSGVLIEVRSGYDPYARSRRRRYWSNEYVWFRDAPAAMLSPNALTVETIVRSVFGQTLEQRADTHAGGRYELSELDRKVSWKSS